MAARLRGTPGPECRHLAARSAWPAASRHAAGGAPASRQPRQLAAIRAATGLARQAVAGMLAAAAVPVAGR